MSVSLLELKRNKDSNDRNALSAFKIPLGAERIKSLNIGESEASVLISTPDESEKTKKPSNFKTNMHPNKPEAKVHTSIKKLIRNAVVRYS
jgi:hypothetical protein